jgi:hypothetical protein
MMVSAIRNMMSHQRAVVMPNNLYNNVMKDKRPNVEEAIPVRQT